MINNSSYADVNAAYSLINSSGIISASQLNFFLRKRGLNDTRIDSVKKILKRERYAYVDSSGEYYSSSPLVDYRKFTDEINKAVWLFIDSLPEMNYVNFKCKIPCIAYICNDENMGSNSVEDYTIFYIRRGTESISNRIINTNFGVEQSKIRTIIIIDDVDQIPLIKLDKPLEIISFATVSNNGKIDYYSE